MRRSATADGRCRHRSSRKTRPASAFMNDVASVSLGGGRKSRGNTDGGAIHCCWNDEALPRVSTEQIVYASARLNHRGHRGRGENPNSWDESFHSLHSLHSLCSLCPPWSKPFP